MNRRSLGYKGFWSACAIAAAIGGWYLAAYRSDAPNPAPLPPLTATAYRNTSSEATYVGMDACIECHTGEHLAYLKTGHSRSLGEARPGEAPPDGQFADARTRRLYRTYRKGGQLWHRESMLADGGDQVVLADYPMRYRIGSGRHSLSYLVEVDGFLFESPVTWYRRPAGWGLSPGYEANNQGFERPASVECLTCHVGRVESQQGSLHRVKLHEQAIGCERCHGPGSLHVALRESEEEANVSPFEDEQLQQQEVDLTIVNPGRLTREKKESICAQCHSGSAISVELRGRTLADFRPGLPMKDFRIEYGLDSPSAAMEVVGHIEQLRLSRCYQSSQSLTCTTCHELHNKPAPEEQVRFYRAKCLTCHQEQSCGLTQAVRRQQNADDNCVACHMPRGPTDLPHFAFTHHRIDVHTTVQRHGPRQGIDSLVALDNVSRLSKDDRSRSLGMAYLQLGYRELQQWGMLRQEALDAYFRRARAILDDAHRNGLRDPEMEAALAEFYVQADLSRATEHAVSALRPENRLSPLARVTALRALAIASYGLGNPERAVEVMERLIRVRRNADDWSLLAGYRQQSGDLAGALEAAQTAAQISPYRPDLQLQIAELYRSANREERAAEHQHRAKQLAKPAPVPSDFSDDPATASGGP